MQNRSKYFLNNKEVSEEEFYSTNNLSVSNPFRGEKQVNEAVKEAIGLSTRHKAGEKMVYLDEVLDNFREDDSPAIKFAERLAQQDERLKEIIKKKQLEEIFVEGKLKETEAPLGCYPNKEALKTKIDFDKAKEDKGVVYRLDEAISQWKELIDGAVEAKHGVKETEGKADYSEINLNILDLMSERMQKNKYKYPPGNSKKPIDLKSLEWALFRHIKKMVQPIENDPESYTEHLAAVLCNSSIILDQLELKNK
jgi:hypothetical protein